MILHSCGKGRKVDVFTEREKEIKKVYGFKKDIHEAQSSLCLAEGLFATS